MTVIEIIRKLKSLGDPDNIAGMERFGIVTQESFGISAPVLKQFEKEVNKDVADRHALAQEFPRS